MCEYMCLLERQWQRDSLRIVNLATLAYQAVSTSYLKTSACGKLSDLGMKTWSPQYTLSRPRRLRA